MLEPEPLEGHPRFEKVKDLNRGGQGFVQLAKDKNTGRHYAIKFMQRGSGVSKYMEREILNHRILWHAHVIKFREVLLTPTHLGIVMEYANGGDMLTYVQERKRLTESQARWMFQQLMVAVDYIHKMGVANRDIKLENTLVAFDNRDRAVPYVKLCDFGFAKHVDNDSIPNTNLGTLQYCAPEVMTSPQYDGQISDIWSCGVMLYVMLVGRYPFERPEDLQTSSAATRLVTMQRIFNMDYSIPDRLKLSPGCKDLISRMLIADPNQRITLQQIQTHSWYRQGLPPGVDEMNQDLTPHESAQSVEEIKSLVEQAQRVG